MGLGSRIDGCCRVVDGTADPDSISRVHGIDGCCRPLLQELPAKDTNS